MRSLQRAAALLALAAAACSAPASPPPDAVAPQFVAPHSTVPYSGGDGSSIENAVVVNARTETVGIRMESEWIYHYNGRFRKISSGLVAQGERHYDVIRVELADHTEKTIFFDISAFFGIDEP